ncbi:MAG: transporter substrate-binding domain-containing protein [Alphaproteobacteria bacterium]|nr:transporter substrate-binding domain-containing protein [Alphaproteobacteria bacterium]
MRAFLVLLCLAMAPKASLAADGSTIRIGMDGLYPPWNATGDNGELEGFEIDLALDLCQRMNAVCELVRQRWDGMLPALATGKYDVIMSGMAITEEREQTIDFSTCYATEVAVFAVKPDNALADTITPADRIDLTSFSPEVKVAINALRQALAGTSVGVQVATTHADFARRYLQDLVDIRFYDTLDNLTRDLEVGRIDAALSSRAYWTRLGKGGNGVHLALIGPDMIGEVFGRGIGAGLRKEDGELRARLNHAIEAALADGTIARLAKRWFGHDLSC